MLWLRYIIGQLLIPIINYQKVIVSKKLKLGYRSRILRNSSFEGYNKVERFSVFSGEMGFGSYIGAWSLVVGKIGRYCSIADKVSFITATHPVTNFVSTHPIFYSLKKQCGLTFVNKQKFSENPNISGDKYSIVVGNDVYIGYGVTVIGPVLIGDGSVIAANSTVTKNVEPYSIVGGNPAKLIKYRFSSKEIDSLKEIKWWDRTISWLQKNADLFEDIDVFLAKVHKE